MKNVDVKYNPDTGAMYSILRVNGTKFTLLAGRKRS
ncbi:MAG: hypothetical protein K0R59_1898 [Sphingobacterium sp.]|jgi:hypothetical protein|nr:hypothetical protein [Sphingobacterium sp.]